MYYFVHGFTPGGQESLGGPFADRTQADAGSKNWMQRKIYEFDSPDRNQAALAINRMRSSQQAPMSQPREVAPPSSNESEDEDEDSDWEYDEDEDEEGEGYNED